MDNAILLSSQIVITDSESDLPSDYHGEADFGVELGSLDSLSEFELASQHQMVIGRSPREAGTNKHSVSTD